MTGFCIVVGSFMKWINFFLDSSVYTPDTWTPLGLVFLNETN